MMMVPYSGQCKKLMGCAYYSMLVQALSPEPRPKVKSGVNENGEESHVLHDASRNYHCEYLISQAPAS